MKTLLAKTDEEATTNADDLVKGIVKEIEPLLANAGPFFGGSSKLTLAEVSIQPSPQTSPSNCKLMRENFFLGPDWSFCAPSQDIRQAWSAAYITGQESRGDDAKFPQVV